MSTYVKLRQEKSLFPTTYRMVSTVIDASPDGMYPIFVIREGADSTEELYMGVASFSDLSRYVENLLTRFTEAGKFGAAIPGDRLKITNAPDLWFDTYFVAPAVFTVSSVDVSHNYLIMTTAKPFPMAGKDFTWELYDSAEITLKASGTQGQCHRQDLTKNTWLRRRWTSLLASASDAEARLKAMDLLVQLVVDDAKKYGTDFVGVETFLYQ